MQDTMQDEHIVFYAFRYALGRRTGAVCDVSDYLKKHWNNLKPHTQEQIKREIKVMIDRGDAGMDCDVESWENVLNL